MPGKGVIDDRDGLRTWESDGLNPAGLVPAVGGVLIRDGAGNLIGAVGVTSDTSDNDEKAAMAGIAAAWLSEAGRRGGCAAPMCQ